MPKPRENKSFFGSFFSKKEQTFLFCPFPCLATLIPLLACSFPSPATAQLALKRVILSSGGVGLFGFEAPVESAGTLRLTVKLDEVDDILKSLDVDDPAGPMVSLRLAGREPLAESFRTLPFKPGDFASAEALLAALVGEAVRIPQTGAEGKILAVSPFQLAGAPNQEAVTRHRLTIATATGIESVVLEDLPGLDFLSDGLRAQVASALAAIAAQRVQDERTLQVTLAKAGSRTVRLDYVVAAPIWRMSYRVTLPPEGDPAPAHLAAYAVVENLSGMDWNGVDLSLTSGKPALFHTSLYTALFGERPEAPPEIPGTVAPAADTENATAALEQAEPPAPAPPPAAPAPPPMQNQIRAGRARMFGAEAAAPPPASVQPQAAQVDFHLSQKITASSGQTLLAPVLDRALPAPRVDYYPAGSTDKNPLVALRITNDTGSALPPGVITLYQQQDRDLGYIGDSRIDTIEPGKTRFASFAADLAVTVRHDEAVQSATVSAKLAHGVLTLRGEEKHSVTFTVATPKSAARTLVLEAPRVPNATVTEPSAGVAQTSSAVRVTQDIPAGTTRQIRVVQTLPTAEVVALMPADVADYAMLTARAGVPAPVRDALRRAGVLREAVQARQEDIDKIGRQRQDIVSGQDRIRHDLASVPANSELARRYLAELSSQEDELDRLHASQTGAEAALDKAKRDLSDYLENLDF